MIDLLIVGAGVAGLTAAHLASEAGLSVDVVEQSSRIGGRIYRREENEYSTNLGAEYIATYHSALITLAQKFNVKLHLDPISKGISLPEKLFYESTFLNKKKLKELELELESLVSELTAFALRLDNLDKDSLLFQELDSLSVLQWLKERNPTPECINFFSDLDPNSHSILGLLYLMNGSGGSRLFTEAEKITAVDGCDSLVNKIYSLLWQKVQLDSVVLKVKPQSDTCAVTTRSNTGKVSNQVYRRVIIAVSPAALLNINVEGVDWNCYKIPQMSKNRTISIKMKDIITVHEDYFVTDSANRIIYVPNKNEIKIHICQHLKGNDIDSVIMSTLKLFGYNYKHVEQIFDVNWIQNKYYGGSYSFLQTNYFKDGYSIQEWNIPNVYLAGDYLIPQFAGYMEGSIRSAANAVELAKSDLHSSRKRNFCLNQY